MGVCGSSCSYDKKVCPFGDSISQQKKFSADRSLLNDSTASMLELRIFLDDVDLTKSLCQYAELSNAGWKELYIPWLNIQEYRSIDHNCAEYQQTKALYIFTEYAEKSTDLSKEEIAYMRHALYDDVLDRSDMSLPKSLFDRLSHVCLRMMHDTVFTEYKLTKQYKEAKSGAKKHTSGVADDFNYMEILGRGGFGVVVHGQKKCTGEHFAIKVQRKSELLKCFHINPYRVMDEKNALVLCSHPFIIGLEYAFQTPSYAIMVMELGTGTLHDAHAGCEDFKMSVDRVIFYAAEITLALNHMHCLGLIYRDLKPSNVVVCANGHIKLVDLGGIIDPLGKQLKMQHSRANSRFYVPVSNANSLRHVPLVRNENTSNISSGRRRANHSHSKQLDSLTKAEVLNFAVFPTDAGINTDADAAPTWAHPDNHIILEAPTPSVDPSVCITHNFISEPNSVTFKPTPKLSMQMDQESSYNNLSIMGTQGYMAPEMAYGDGHYTKNIDWWTLGILMFELLYDRSPFVPEVFSDEGFFIPGSMATNNTKQIIFDDDEDFGFNHNFFGDFNNAQKFDSSQFLLYFLMSDGTVIDADLKDLLARLLSVNTGQRLGAGRNGVRNVKQHACFGNISWSKLEQMKMPPPVVPSPAEVQENPQYGCFDELMREVNGDEDEMPYPGEDEQLHFRNWDYISSRALRTEIEMPPTKTI